MPFKIYIVVITVLLLSGCMTNLEKFTRATPTEIGKWSDNYLCTNAYWKNPTIRNEIISRKLLTNDEYENFYVTNDRMLMFSVGMPKCAMWTFSTHGKLISENKLSDGSVTEVWEVMKGERFFFFFGGFYYYITLENNRITKVESIK